MSEECTHNCETCSSNCGGIKKEAPHEMSQIGRSIAVISGKGGVGKSMVTSMLAAEARRRGKLTAVLDADITGPSIPRTFGIHGHAEGSDLGIFAPKSKTGVSVMSVNLLLENETDPVIWRGPVIANMVTQFWKEVIWGKIDEMFIDMPPGTGDVPLTVFQSIPIDGIIIVTTPQELVSMIVEKAVKMAEMMNIPILGIVENMSYYTCPDCGKQHAIFGESRLEEVAAKYGIKKFARMPIDPSIAQACDAGEVESLSGPAIAALYDMIAE